MTSTADSPLDPRDLPPGEVLSALSQARLAADREEARILALAVAWIDAHPVNEDHPAVTFSASEGVAGETLSRTVVEARLGGTGTPGVSEFAVEALAPALGLSYGAALTLVSEAVELCFRLPRLWALVQDGRLQAWKARRDRAGRPRRPWGLVRPPSLHRHHRRDRPSRHVGRAGPAGVRR
ncbi:MAG: hypothetical protein ABIQ59_03915 [Nocardioidaceae bacterium]